MTGSRREDDDLGEVANRRCLRAGAARWSRQLEQTHRCHCLGPAAAFIMATPQVSRRGGESASAVVRKSRRQPGCERSGYRNVEPGLSIENAVSVCAPLKVATRPPKCRQFRASCCSGCLKCQRWESTDGTGKKIDRGANSPVPGNSRIEHRAATSNPGFGSCPLKPQHPSSSSTTNRELLPAHCRNPRDLARDISIGWTMAARVLLQQVRGRPKLQFCVS
jgi:hypothetical protein